jgi:hypothetical protein
VIALLVFTPGRTELLCVGSKVKSGSEAKDVASRYGLVQGGSLSCGSSVVLVTQVRVSVPRSSLLYQAQA